MPKCSNVNWSPRQSSFDWSVKSKMYFNSRYHRIIDRQKATPAVMAPVSTITPLNISHFFLFVLFGFHFYRFPHFHLFRSSPQPLHGQTVIVDYRRTWNIRVWWLWSREKNCINIYATSSTRPITTGNHSFHRNILYYVYLCLSFGGLLLLSFAIGWVKSSSGHKSVELLSIVTIVYCLVLWGQTEGQW